jgi:hypothetical protein
MPRCCLPWLTAAALVVAFFAVKAVTAVVEYDRYAGGYVPSTRVTDEAALDLDQRDANLVLSQGRIIEGYIMYRQGGHAGSYARLTLTNLALQYDGEVLLAGETITGESSFSEPITGFLKENVQLSSADGRVNVLEVVYPVKTTQTEHVECQVGGLIAIARANRDGCT